MIQHYSVSSCNLAAQCPRAWWAKYVLKKERAASEAASFGSQYDELICERLGVKLHREGKGGAAVDGVEEAATGYLCQPHALKTATDGQLEINITPDQWAVLAEMHGCLACIERPILGYADLWDSKNRIVVDLKTSKAKRVTPDWALQVLLYSLALQAGQAKVHLMTRTKTPAWYEFLVPLNREAFAWAINKLTYQINLIEGWLKNGCGEELPRTPDYHCAWCPEELDCPAQNLILEV